MLFTYKITMQKYVIIGFCANIICIFVQQSYQLAYR